MTNIIDLTGKFLIALPGMGDHRFKQAVIYICSHDEAGAMGIIINKQKGPFTLSHMLEQIGVEGTVQVADMPVLDGGPVDIDRGFVLHSPDDGLEDSGLVLTESLTLTATRDILDALTSEKAPTKAVLAVGYSGWGAGQIERELQENTWITVEADEMMIFDGDLSTKWERAIRKLGITPDMLAHKGGRA